MDGLTRAQRLRQLSNRKGHTGNSFRMNRSEMRGGGGGVLSVLSFCSFDAVWLMKGSDDDDDDDVEAYSEQ